MEESSGFRFGDAIKAGFFATLIMTVVMYLLGTDSMMKLGQMTLGEGASKGMIYLAGGLVHFGIGIVYALIYAIIFAPMAFLMPFLKALVFSVLMTAAAHYMMPHLPGMLAKVGSSVAGNPCNPCGGYENPCNPCGDQMNPCNPCADGKKAMVQGWINHLIFALAVGMIYRRRK